MDTPLITADARALAALGRVEILYTDLDGTLLAPGGSLLADSSGSPSTALAETIVELAHAGVTIVPISGRNRVQLTELTRLVGWRDFIAEAGAVIVRGAGAGATIAYNYGAWSASTLAPGDTPYDVIERSGVVDALQQAFPGLVEYHTPWDRRREATHLLRGCLDVAEAQAVIDHIDPPVDLIDNGMVRNAGTLKCTDGARPHAYHLVPRGVSKAQAIALDLAARGLDRFQAAAIGDSATDIQMANSVAAMTLVANAFESSGVLGELAERPRDNIWRTAGQRCEGWSEFARIWLGARAG